MSSAAVAALTARCGLVILFLPFSAADKLFGWRGALSQCAEVFRPRPLASFVLLCGLGIEVFGSLGIVTGTADRLAALVMAGYCGATALLYKRFWATGDFRAGPDSKGRQLFWDFLKNLSLGSGFLLIVVGLDGHGLAQLLADPLGSTHPYGAR